MLGEQIFLLLFYFIIYLIIFFFFNQLSIYTLLLIKFFD